MGYNTALQFADIKADDIARGFNITVQRTWQELNGIPCADMERDSEAQRKQMCSSRSFARSIEDADTLAQAMAAFATTIGRKLREMHLCAVSIGAFLQTNSFRQDLPQYSNSCHMRLDEPTNDTMRLAEAAQQCMRRIFRRGYAFKRAGILVHEIVAEGAAQASLFVSEDDRRRRQRIMQAVDAINRSAHAHDKVHVGSYTPLSQLVRHERDSHRQSTLPPIDIIRPF